MITNGMPKTAGGRLEADVRSVHEYCQVIEDRLSDESDNRVLVVLSAGPGADALYGPALTRLFQQMGESNRRANVVLALNNGTRFPVHFDPPETETVFLKSAPHQFAGMTAPVSRAEDGPDRLHTLFTSDSHEHTLHVLRQPESPHSAGKINALRDVFGMLMHSCVVKGAVPRTALFMDAESHFYRAPDSHLKAPDPDTNGLAVLLDSLEGMGAPHILGAKVRFCVYRTMTDAQERLPDFDMPISDLHVANNWAHGRLKHRYFSGGAIAGRTGPLLALGQTVAKYPGLRSEDSAEVLLAQQAGIRWGMDTDVLYTNSCPPASDREKTLEQLARWGHGRKALLELYGVRNLEGYSRFERFAGALNDLLYLVRHPSHALWVLQDKRDVREAMKLYPDEHPLDGPAGWTAA
ncbi:MAG TPA: hypothetical protein PKV72_02015 [Candidatus Peribacteria bacterium]|nr:hypothetical protein [Candidatus Peribacteria bacterium]